MCLDGAEALAVPRGSRDQASWPLPPPGQRPGARVGQVPAFWAALSPSRVLVFYLTTGPSDFELLRRSVKAAFLLESKEETDLMFCPQGDKQAHFN